MVQNKIKDEKACPSRLFCILGKYKFSAGRPYLVVDYFLEVSSLADHFQLIKRTVFEIVRSAIPINVDLSAALNGDELRI